MIRENRDHESTTRADAEAKRAEFLGASAIGLAVGVPIQSANPSANGGPNQDRRPRAQFPARR